jgi:hypothetical protein
VVGILLFANAVYGIVAHLTGGDLTSVAPVVMPVELVLRLSILAGFVSFFRRRRIELLPALGLNAALPAKAAGWGAVFALASLPPVGLLILAGGYLALRHALALETFLFQQPARPVWSNLLTQTRVLVTYLRLLFWPLNLSLEHQVPIIESFTDPSFLASTLLWVALLVAALLRLRRNRDARGDHQCAEYPDHARALFRCRF